MKTQLTLLMIALVCSFFISTAQIAPEIEWQNTIGGVYEDYLYSVQQTADGGYILGGYSNSGISGDKTEANQGGSDYWLVKLDGSGNIEWQNTIGGSSDDRLFAVQQTADGGYILGGYSYSGISGDKTEASLGGTDYWVVKLDGSGNIVWQNTIGGSSDDNLKAVQQTADGGYILGGLSFSGISGDKTEASLGVDDCWVVKLDGSGNIEWQNTIGGSDFDGLSSVQQTADGGYILGGESSSDNSGDKTEASLGGYDYWVVKLDGSGNIEWQNTIGGSYSDILVSVQQTADGGYILGGYSESGISGDKTEANLGYYYDYWVVKLDGSGNIEWQNTIGGSDSDELLSVQQTADGGYILGGYSWSYISGDKTEASLAGNQDYWVVKLHGSGNIEWQNTIGGSDPDELLSVQQTADGGCILGGYSNSGISGDKTEASLGGSDYWVVKLTPECSSGTLVYLDNDGDTYGNVEESLFVLDCIAPSGYVYNSSDCNDEDADIHPGACDASGSNGIDDNCDGIIDNGYGAATYYVDADGDGYGVGIGTSLCSNPGIGFSTNNTDCNDADATVHALGNFYVDTDGDTYGTGSLISICYSGMGTPAGYSVDNTDCDDANSEINPGASEVFNGLDDNCNGIIDDIVCNPPTGLLTKDITATSVKFKWEYSAASYKLRYKVATSGSWILLGPTGQSKTVEGMLSNTKYVWQVKSVCNVDPKITSEWSEKQFFTTTPLRMGDERATTIQIYPNPTSEKFILDLRLYSAASQPATIYLLNAFGQVVYSSVVSVGNGELIKTITMPSTSAAGWYLVKVVMSDQVIEQKLLYQK